MRQNITVNEADLKTYYEQNVQKMAAKEERRASHILINAPKDAKDRWALKDFPKGSAGIGLQVAAIDMDADGDIDLVCPGKSGLYMFENLGR